MSTYESLLMPEGEWGQEVSATLVKMHELCLQYKTAENAREILDALHSNYWQIIISIVPNLIQENNKEQFSIPEALIPWISFGCVSEILCPECQAKMTIDRSFPDDLKELGTEYEIVYFHEWLKRCHERNIRLEKKERVLSLLQKAQEDLTNYPVMIQKAHDMRQEFLARFPRAKEVMEVSEEIDRVLPFHQAIKEKIEGGERVTTQERIQYVQLNEQLSELRELRAREQQAISDKVPQHELMRMDREIEGIILLKHVYEKNIAAAAAAVKEDTLWREGMSVPMCREMIKEELRRIRIMVDLVSKRSHVKPCSLLLEDAHVPQPREIVSALEEILEVDPSLFVKSSTKKVRFPSVLIIPGFGDGVYDFENNCLLIPIRTPKGLLQAVATALIEYHLEQESGNRFRESYLRLGKNSAVYSSIQLRENMLRDYLGWVTLEAKGYQVLDNDTRKWFIETVAPTMFALKHPRRMGDMTIQDAHDKISALGQLSEEEQNVHDKQLLWGVASWRVGEYAKAFICFAKALELKPDSKDACYNAALAAFKTAQKTRAIEYWRRYLTIDKASFWVSRVQKFLSTVKE